MGTAAGRPTARSPMGALDRTRHPAPHSHLEMALLPRARRSLALALVLGPLLVGCANNPVARQLAASFDSPAAAPPAGSPPTAAGAPAGAASPPAQGPAGANSTAGSAGSTPTPPKAGVSAMAEPDALAKPGQQGSSPTAATDFGPGGKVAGKGNAPATSTKGANGAAGAIPKGPPPQAAAPYRVTLKLPGADPSAPAEVVTRALRAAGVSFEVETIERIGAGGDGGSTSRPATLRSTPAPAVR